MEFKLEDFFPLYPESLSNNSKTRFEIGSLDVINTLKEFTDNRLDAIEILPTKPGEATKHQLLLEDYFLDILNLMLCYLFMKWELEKRVPLYKQLNKI